MSVTPPLPKITTAAGVRASKFEAEHWAFFPIVDGDDAIVLNQFLESQSGGSYTTIAKLSPLNLLCASSIKAR